MTDTNLKPEPKVPHVDKPKEPLPEPVVKIHPRNGYLLMRLDRRTAAASAIIGPDGVSKAGARNLPSGVVLAVGGRYLMEGVWCEPQYKVGDHVAVNIALALRAGTEELPIGGAKDEHLYTLIHETQTLGILEGADENSPWFCRYGDMKPNVFA